MYECFKKGQSLQTRKDGEREREPLQQSKNTETLQPEESGAQNDLFVTKTLKMCPVAAVFIISVVKFHI